MFHVMLVLPILLVLAAVAFVIVLGIVAMVAALVGGTTVALLIKNKTTKKLLFIGFCILFLVGLLCVTPMITTYLNLPAMVLLLAAAIIYVCIAVLAIAGIKLANAIDNKAGKIVLVVVFSLVLIADISLAGVTALARAFFA